MCCPIVRLIDKAGEIWRGSVRQFYRDNDMGRVTARGIHKQLRSYGDANVGGGACSDFRLVLVKCADLRA